MRWIVRSLVSAVLLCSVLVLAAAKPYNPNFMIEVSVMTTFAHDAGEMPRSVSFKGQQYPPDQAAEAILPKLGWCYGDDDLREALAIAWIKQVASVGNRYLQETSSEAKAIGYTGPKVVFLDSGSVEVTMPIQHLMGRNPESVYRPRVFRFSRTGRCVLLPDNYDRFGPAQRQPR